MVNNYRCVLGLARLASTVVGTMKEAVQTLPYKNAVKFVGEKEHFNYTTFVVSVCCFFLWKDSNIVIVE